MTKKMVKGFDYSPITREDGTPDITVKAKLIRQTQLFLLLSKQANASLVQAGVELSIAHETLAGIGRDGLFAPWLRSECYIGRRCAYRYMQMGKAFGHLTSERDNTLKMFTQEALLTLAGKNVPDQALKDAIHLAAKGNPVNLGVAKEYIAKHTVVPAPISTTPIAAAPGAVPGLAKDIADLVNNGELLATEKELTGLARHDAPSQRALLANVKEGCQSLADAVISGEVVEPTAEQEMTKHNKAIDSVTRQMTQLIDELKSPWITPKIRENIKSAARAIAGTARACKGVGVCPKCNGEGCKICHKTGFLPKIEMGMHGE